MRRIDKALQSVGNIHRQENYVGPLASTSGGGHVGNVNNLYNSQVRGAKNFMPYGISSRPFGGVVAQAVVNDNNGSSIVGVYDPARPKVGTGEVCLYSAGGCTIYLSSTGDISIRTNNADMDIRNSGMIDIYNSSGSINIDTNGEIKIAKGNAIVNITKDDDINITSGDTGVEVMHDGNIDMYNSIASINITEEGDINVTSGDAGVEVMHDDSINVHNSTTSVSIDNNGKITMKATNDIKLDTTGKIEFKCTEFKVNNQTMIVP